MREKCDNIWRTLTFEMKLLNINIYYIIDWASLVAQRLSVCLQCRRPGFDPWVRSILWRRKWQPTPVLLPGESHGQRSLVGYSPQGRKESDTTEHVLSFYSFFWRRKWQPTPVFLPGESQGQRGLVGYSLWDCKELDTTKQLTHTMHVY